MYKQKRQLDFEDEPPDDEGSASEESDSEENEEEDDDSDADQFQDALENLTLSEPVAVVAAAA